PPAPSYATGGAVMVSATVTRQQKHRPERVCRVCGGHALMRQGRGIRCWGYLSGDGLYEHCTRPEYAGSIALHKDGTYPHRLGAPCRCGVTHASTAPVPVVVEVDARRESEQRTDGARRLWTRGRES